MDILSFLVIISAGANLLLGYFILIRGGKNRITFSLAFCAIVSGIWAISLYFYYSPLVFSNFFWIKTVYLITFFIVFNLFYFSLVFPHQRLKSTFLPSALYWVISFPLLYTLFFTKLWIKNIIYKPWGPETILGPVYILVITIWSFFATWALYNLIRSYFTSTGIENERIKYVLIGMALFIFVVAMIDGVIPILTGDTQYFRISPLSSLFFVVFTTYAIIRYRLMDIRFVVGRGAVYLFSIATVLTVAFSLMHFNEKLIQPLPFNVAGSLIIVLSVLLFQFFFRFFEKFASKYFYYTFYSYQMVLTDLGRGLTRVLDLDKLSSLILSTLTNTMKLDRAVILLREPGNGDYKIQKNIGFKEENGISLVKDNFLTIYLEATQKPLVYEEISLISRDSTDKKEKERLALLQTNMKRIEAALCLPLLIEGKIAGMIVLGNKISGDPYSQQDIDLLTNLANQASVALQNAKLYNQVQDLSENLQEKVDVQTKELKEAYEELKTLDKAKSEFLSIASHQLRTPLTAIKGYLSMMIEKSYGKPPEKMKRPLENIYLSNERLIKLVNDLLNVSRIEAGEIELKFEPSSVEEIIDSVVEELKQEAKSKNLYIKWERPKKVLPKLSIDKDRIRQVVLNILDNAIRYTNHGGITVKIQNPKSKIQIVISDTGEGMTGEEISHLFESFSRGGAGARFWTEGAGLGLYIAKKFIDLHKGNIRAESKGKGKGSTFYMELPIK